MTEQKERIGKYQILQEIGRGGFAVVRKAHDLSLDRVVALKMLHTAYTKQPDVVQRFLREAQRVVRLQHNGIVRVYDVGEHQGQPYIAMKYLPGGSLADRLTGEPLSLETAVTILEQVAAALDYAHQRQLVHRDVKPANVLFDEDGNAVLADFGLVKSLVESGMTVDGTRLGTPTYMAPEQCQAGADVTAAADVYALGVVAYEMLTGQVPFSGKPVTVVHAHIYEPPPDPRVKNEHLSRRVARVLLKALSKSARERYPTATAFIEALRQAQGTAEEEKPQRDRRWPADVFRDRPWLGVAAIVVIISLLLTVASIVYDRIVAPEAPTQTDTVTSTPIGETLVKIDAVLDTGGDRCRAIARNAQNEIEITLLDSEGTLLQPEVFTYRWHYNPYDQYSGEQPEDLKGNVAIYYASPELNNQTVTVEVLREKKTIVVRSICFNIAESQ